MSQQPKRCFLRLFSQLKANHKDDHTGQDPVYKSTIGKEIFDVPFWKKKPLETDFEIGLRASLIQIILNNDTWASDFVTPTIGFVPSNGYDIDWTNTQTPTVETPSTAISFGSNVPAPPAFLLLVGSMLSPRRRR